MLKNVALLAAITFIPTLELRASIPYGILALQWSWWSVFLICSVANIFLGPIIYWLLDSFLHFFLKIGWIDRFYQRTVLRTQKKIEKVVEKYGEWGVAIFIGIPLPGSGRSTRALGAYLIGLSFRQFFVANVIGVLIEAAIVTAVCLTGVQVFDFFIQAPEN